MNEYRFTMEDGREFEIHADNRQEANSKLTMATNGRGTIERVKEFRHG